MLKRVFGGLSLKSSPGKKKFSDRATYQGIVFIGNFPPVMSKDFL